MLTVVCRHTEEALLQSVGLLTELDDEIKQKQDIIDGLKAQVLRNDGLISSAINHVVAN